VTFEQLNSYFQWFISTSSTRSPLCVPFCGASPMIAMARWTLSYPIITVVEHVACLCILLRKGMSHITWEYYWEPVACLYILSRKGASRIILECSRECMACLYILSRKGVSHIIWECSSMGPIKRHWVKTIIFACHDFHV